MRERLIKRMANLAVNRTKLMIWIMAGVTVVLGALSGGISMSPKWSDMLPAGDRRTIEFDRILEEFQSASSIVVVAQGPEVEIKAFAEDLAPRLLKPLSVPGKDMEPHIYVRRVDYKTEVDFIKEHGFMLMKEDDLDNLKDVFQDPGLVGLLTNMNNSFEKEYIQPDESISSREEEDGAVIFLNGIDSWLGELKQTLAKGQIEPSAAEAAVDKLLLGEPYFLSYDHEALILNVVPTFSMVDTYLMVDGTDAVQGVVTELLKSYPNVQAGLTGSIPLGRDEMVYGTQGIGLSMILSFIAIGALLFMAFKMWVAPLLALLNLFIGLIWAAGLVAIFVPVLNIMTAMFIVILLGLGIDFSIHVISTFTEMRGKGLPLSEAMEAGLLKSGKGVSTGALTTAVAFLALMIGDSRAMSEMGLVTAIGLIAVMISSFVVLPTFLAIREKRLDKRLALKGSNIQQKKSDLTFKSMGRAAAILQNHPWKTLLGLVVLTGLFFVSAKRISFNYNYMDLEPEGIPSITLQDTVQDKFDLSMDFAYLVAESVDEARELTRKAKTLPSVASVDDISTYLPSLEQQARRRPHIEEVRKMISAKQIKRIDQKDLPTLVSELERLEMNIMEFQSMSFLGGQDKIFNRAKKIVGGMEETSANTIFTKIYELFKQDKAQLVNRLNIFQEAYADYFRSSVLKMAGTDTLTLETLPESVLDRYASRDRTLFLTTVLPSGNIWQDFQFLATFTDDLDTISNRSTGMPPVFRALMDVVARDGKNAALLTIVLVYILLLIDFKHFGIALLAMLPLATGAIWMVGIMDLLGLQLDVVNVMALPLILGIGIDDGVHIVHRWRLEGARSASTVFASTGKAVLLTSVTTMLAFGSMMFSAYRGYASLSYALIIGVGACFFTTVILLPAIMGIADREKEKA
ncbi:MAG: MMPL family transporter [Candidatus Marinimicrobia bacterium]|nr:MMPL family transporter [Candidatus Neomarinimicrobiota bacterium]